MSYTNGQVSSVDPSINVEVHVHDSGNPERALKRFKRMCEAYGVTKEYRKRQAYKKPSIKKKEKFQAAQKRKAKLERKMRGSRASKI